MRIDRTKLKAAIKKAEASEAGSWTFPSNPYPLLLTQDKRKSLKCGYVKFFTKSRPNLGWTFTASECQILYAIAAQARGHLSIQKKWVPLLDATGGRELVEFTLEMQKELIGDAWKEFTREEPTLVPVEELAKVSA